MTMIHTGHPLMEEPLWRDEDLGKPIPDSPHAISVSLPLWKHVIGYEEGDASICDTMQLGYPRFVIHPCVNTLSKRCAERFAKDNEATLAFPSKRSAERCLAFVHNQCGVKGRCADFELNDIWAVMVPESASQAAHDYWQHSGDIISSRMAEATLQGKSDSGETSYTKLALQTRISQLAGVHASNVFLFPTGMAALSTVQRVLQRLTPEAKSIQLGFPYVDLMKLQEKIGAGYHFFPSNKDAESQEFRDLINHQKISGVFTDLPGNPLLGTASLPHLSALLRPRMIPLIVDDTVGTFYNVDAMPYADIVMSSLTKYFSGISDVMGGALIVNDKSPFYPMIRHIFQEECENLLWGEDAMLLAERSFDFETRMVQINRTAEDIADYLHGHSLVEQVYYPKFQNRGNYSAVMRDGGGFGGLMSILLKNAKTTAPVFYDHLRVSKGPSFGTNYTLACPYTLLAHYDELDSVESDGVSRYLIRLSIGLEDFDDLKGRLDRAFSHFFH